MEHYDISLAVMVLKLCWDIDDAIYLKVNAQAKQKGLKLSEQAKKTLYSLNEPDYVLYDHFNKTLWKTVDELGRERVEVRDSPNNRPFCQSKFDSTTDLPDEWSIPHQPWQMKSVSVPWLLLKTALMGSSWLKVMAKSKRQLVNTF